jgi:hypothetical protein
MRLHTAAYRLTLRLYPAAFRKAYGPEMTHLFTDILADQRRTGNWLNIFRLWAHLMTDTVSNATKERLEQPMKNRTGLIRFLLAALLIVSVQATLLGGALFLTVVPAAVLVIVTMRVRLFRDAVFEREQRRWWVWPAGGALVIGAAVGAAALPMAEDARWAIWFFGVIGGAVIVAASIGRTLMLMARRPQTPTTQ